MSSDLVVKDLDKAAAEAYALTRNISASFAGSLGLARVVSKIRSMLTIDVVREAIMPLKETQFGWKTDGRTYSDEQLRDVWVSACMVGAKPVNNEVNVISGQCYLAKNYFKRVLKEYPGLTEFNPVPGEIKTYPNGAIVGYSATWKLDGKPMSRTRTGPSAIPVRLNTGMGADAALGKAERKFLADVLSYITGTQFDDGEVDDALEPIASVASSTQHVAAEKTAATALPAPKKEQQTQTKAVVEKLKKTVGVVTEAEPDNDPAPWDIAGDANPAIQPTQQTQETAQPTPQSAPQTAVAKTAETQPKKTEKAAPKQELTKQPEPPKQPAAAPPVADPEPSSPDVIEKDMIGQIASIRSSKDKKPPYTILSDNGTQYVTPDIEMAKKAKKYLDGKVPVEIEYTIEPSGKYSIVDINAAELGGDPNEPGSDDGSVEMEPA